MTAFPSYEKQVCYKLHNPWTEDILEIIILSFSKVRFYSVPHIWLGIACMAVNNWVPLFSGAKCMNYQTQVPRTTSAWSWLWSLPAMGLFMVTLMNSILWWTAVIVLPWLTSHRWYPLHIQMQKCKSDNLKWVSEIQYICVCGGKKNSFWTVWSMW